MPTKRQAFSILIRAQKEDAANMLLVWRNRTGDDKGWDGWIRKAYPHVVPLLWSDDGREPDPAEEYARAFDAKCHP